MYCAVLKTTLIVSLRRTKVSTVKAVTPAISIGHGCSNKRTDAIIGTKATDVPRLAKENRREDVSQRIDNAANATTAFQEVLVLSDGMTHGFVASSQAAPHATSATSA